MPHRFQIKRRKGWKKPRDGVVVARPGRWGNPFKISKTLTRDQAVAMFEQHLASMPPKTRDAFLAPLRGKDLGCWCPLDVPCHADVLLKWANR
jgi:hypothetical protein